MLELNDATPETPENILARGISGSRMCYHIPEDDLKRLEEPGVKVLWAKQHGGWYTEREMVALVRLADEGFAVLHEGEDYTGHGCQCSAEVAFYRTLDKAVRLGLVEYERQMFLKDTRLD
jgi:hypothetical protein